MAKKTSAKRSKAAAGSPKAVAGTKARGAKTGGGSKSGGGSRESDGIKGASDALVKLLESPLVAELLAVGASAALATLAAQRLGRGDDGLGTRRALKGAVKAAANAMGTRIAAEFDEIKQSAAKTRA